MIVDNNSSSGVPTVSVLVRRGDELPKKNYETKLHPTYEVGKLYLEANDDHYYRGFSI